MTLGNTRNKEVNNVKKKTLRKYLSLFLLLMVSLLTFSACSLFGNNDGTNSSFDANGDLRIPSPIVTFNPYSVTDAGNVIDENSGSFTWELMYYLSSGTDEQLKDANYDQMYYLANFYVDANFEEVYRYYQYTDKKPIYSSSRAEILEYFGLTGTSVVANISGAHFYGVFQESGATVIRRVYTAAEYVIQNKAAISFPDYEVVVDGKYYTFRVTLNNLNNLVVNPGEYNPFSDGTGEDASLFKFEYRTGKASSGSSDFLECPSGYMTYYVDDYGRFMIRFNPRLEEGSTNRYLKVRAISKTEGRGDSLYSSTVSFEAYSVTFSSYSANSVDLTYGPLIYDSDSFYFHNIKTTYDSANNQNYISSLTGVFPEGRKVVVSRETLYTEDYDYALQSWTTNAYAENSLILGNTIPKGLTGFTLGSSDYNGMIGDNCIPTAMKTGSEAFQNISYKYSYSSPSYYDKSHINDPLSSFVYEHLYGYYMDDSSGEYEMVVVPVSDESKTVTRSDLIVVSHAKINGYKFYANFAKVRNFVASGTFFAGDNFFTNSNQYLTGVTISVFDKNGQRLIYTNAESESVFSAETITETGNSSVNRTKAITFVFDGAYFMVTGLEYGDFLYFEKEGAPLVNDGFTSSELTLPYSFHSSYMEKKFIEYLGAEYKILNLQPNSTTYSDRQDIGIIGTQYAEESNLVVNLYQIAEDGDAEQISDTGLKLLQNGDVGYEIIKSVSSYEDEYGYITTNVIISLILPSNATLIGYNTETLNTNTDVYYMSTASGKIYLVTQKYNASTLEYDATGYYEFSTALVDGDDVRQTTTSTYIEYNGELYVYDHKSGKQNGDHIDTTYYYTKVNQDESAGADIVVLAKTDSVSGTIWNLVTYTPIDDSRITAEAIENENGQVVPVIKIDGEEVVLYSASTTDPVINTEANEVSFVATVYGTDMVQTQTDNDTNATNTNDVYVYYDTKLVNGTRYYTSPIAKKKIIQSSIDEESGSASISEENVLYYKEISNFDALHALGVIMLGEDILSGSNDFSGYAAAYREVMGARIIQSCYYYVKPLGDANQVLIKQYINEETNDGEANYVTHYYYYAYVDGRVQRIEYTGPVASVNLVENNKKIYSSSIELYNIAGDRIDPNNSDYNKVINNKLYDATGNIKYYFSWNYDRDDPPTVSPSRFYRYSHQVVEGYVEEGLDPNYVFVETAYNNVQTYSSVSTSPTGSIDLRYAYTLYTISDDGDIITTQLYYDGSKYYEILETKYITKETNNDGVISTEVILVSMIDQTKGFTLSIKNPTSDNFIDRLTVSYINGVSTKVTYTQNVLNSSGNPTTETFTSYNAYLIPSYYVKNSDGTETQLYQGLNGYWGDTINIAIPTVIKPIFTAVYEYTTNMAFTTNESGELVYSNGNPVRDSNGRLLDQSGNYITDTNGNYIMVSEDGFIMDGGNKTDKLASQVDLYAVINMEAVVEIETALVRTAQTVSGNVQVTVLGKYIQTNDADNPQVYPSFSSLNSYTEEEAYTILENEEGLFDHYYSLDYTSTSIVIEGFPGVTLLSGPPYPNPVLYFSIRHKASEDAVINLSFDIKNAYYVELMGTFIQTEDSNLIRDFTTYAFKDTLTNLSLNDYIDKTFYILDATTLKPVIPYVLNAQTGEYEAKLLDADGNPVELNIQDVGINDGDFTLYYGDVVGANGKYINKVYMAYTDTDGSTKYKPINYEEDVILWKSDSTKIEDVAMYDIHSYEQGKDGIIYFNSGSSTDDNTICIGLEGISSGATASTNGVFDYSSVLISGVTYAYRTKTSQLNISNDLYGYWFDKGLNILNAYNSNDAYFLSGDESAVIIASPTVSMTDDAGVEYIYRFKEWQIYSRYNSEVLYYNRGVTENLIDRYNAILRFSSNEAGYFVVLPVYERVFSIDIGTAVIDGALNQGGGINVQYNNGDEVDVENKTDTELYLVDYFKTTYNNREGYFYGDITGSAYLYFTGEFNVDGLPVFETVEDIYVMRYSEELNLFSTGDIQLFYKLNINSSDRVTGISPVRVLSSLRTGEPGLVMLNNTNGLYTFYYNTRNVDNTYSDTTLAQYFGYQDGFLLRVTDASGYREIVEVEFSELINYAFTANFFFDTITSENDNSYTSTSLYYDPETKYFDAIDVSMFDTAISNRFGGGYITSFFQFLVMWNFYMNSHMFSNANVAQAIGNSYYLSYSSFASYIELGSPVISANVSLTNLLGDRVAQSFTNIFTALDRVTTNPIINGMYVSNKGSLSPGELMFDEDGNLYSTQQFKNVYIDRDSYVELVAVPDNGYRVEGWYKCVYDEETNTWYTTDEKASNSDFIYSDEILQAEYNTFLKTYYYITDYFEDWTYGRVYYYDEEKTEEAIVPSNMLDKVRGYFINTGSESRPNYVQVYRKGTVGDSEYFYDPQYSNRVNLENYEVVELTYISAINRTNADNNLYTLSNVPVYRVVDELNKEHFYRARNEGNIIVDGNTLRINTLHSNIRYVAKFIETYNEYIFAEGEEASGINVLAVYYNNSDEAKLDEDEVVIRTDSFGNNRTDIHYDEEGNSYGDPIVNTMDRNLFRLYEDEAKTTTLTSNFMAGFITQETASGTQTFRRYTDGSSSIYNSLISSGFNSIGKTYQVDPETDDTLNGKLTLRSMYFDVHTTVYIVVSVKAEYELSIHSLGLNSSYTIEPIIAPTDEFVAYNQGASAEEKVDYVYYVFKITYDRDPENEYASYIVHPTRGDGLAYDVLAGNYLDFYGKYFNIYDNYNNVIGYTISYDANGNQQVKLSSSYLNTLVRQGVISSELANQIRVLNFENIAEAFEEICRVLKNPEALYSTYIVEKDETNDEENRKRSSRQIFDAIRIITNEDGTYFFKSPRLIYAGQRNFVNFSTVPIYNYTIQTLTIDGYEKDDSGEFVYDENGKYVSNNNKLHSINNSFYTSAGTNDKTYVGVGTQIQLDTPFIYVDANYNEETRMPFSTWFEDVEYGNGGLDNTVLEDLAMVENTILLLSGAQEPETGYAFVGWFEQKYDRESGNWTELTLMSNELETPYLSMSTADTIIVAVYKKVIDINITYNNQELTIQMPDVSLVNEDASDSENINKISIVTNGNTTTISGKFYFDYELKLTIAPAGGYRFSSLSFETIDSELGLSNLRGEVDLNNEYVVAVNSEGEDVKFSDVVLNSVFGIKLPVKSVIGTDTEYDTLNLTINTKRVVLVYINVENFYTTSGGLASIYNHGGFNFGLYNVADPSNPILLARTVGTSYTDFFETFEKDSTQSYIKTHVNSSGNPLLSNNNFYMYGYFDYDLSGKLALITYQEKDAAGISQWYINGYSTPTSDIASLNSNIFTGEKSSEFIINFLYSDANVDLNRSDRFALSENNTTYYANAKIEATSEMVVSHSFITNINDVSRTGVSAGTGDYSSVNVYSLMTYNGRYFYYDNGALTSQYNSSLAISNTNSYLFDSDAVINLTVNSRFIEVGGELYVFVGWFTGSYGYGENVQTRLVSTELSIVNLAPSGFYEAKYVKVNKVTVSGNENGQLSVSQTNELSFNGEPTVVYGYYETGDYYYIYTGANLIVDAYPTADYILPDFQVRNTAGEDVTEGKLVENLVDYQRLTMSGVKEDLIVYANFEKGFRITINQTLYPSIDTNQDGTEMSGVYVTMSYNSADYKVLSATVPSGTSVTFNYDESSTAYYFVGWYINGQIVSRLDNKYLTSYTQIVSNDLVIEARFVPMIQVSVSGLIYNTNTSISNFAYKLTYTDLRDNVQKEFSNASLSSYLYIPSGTVVTIEETRPQNTEGNPYTFVGWAQVDTYSSSIIRTFSTEKVATVSLSNSLTNNTGTLRLVAEYVATTTIDLSKLINIREEDMAEYYVNGEQGDQFKSYFDLILTYTDPFGNYKTTRMGSLSELTDILVRRGTPVYISYTIASTVSSRYSLSSLTYQSLGITTDITFSGSGSQEIPTTDRSSIIITGVFGAFSTITISKELNGEITASPNIEINYNFTDESNNSIENGSVSSSSVSLVIPSFSGFEITTSALSGETFIGWYNSGRLISTSPTITNADISPYGSISLVAKYITTTNVTIVRTVDGEETASSDLAVTITGNILSTSGTVTNDYSVKTLYLNSTNQSRLTDITMLTNTNVVLTATHMAGYEFVGFTISIDGENAYSISSVAGSYNTVATTLVSPCESVVITAEYITHRVVNYQVTTINGETNSSNGGSITNQTKFLNDLENEVSFTLNINSNYRLAGLFVNGTALGTSYTSGQTVTIDVSGISGDINIEVRFARSYTLTIMLSVNGTGDGTEIRNKLGITRWNYGTIGSGSVSTTMSGNYVNRSVTLSPNSSLGGYVFEGWYIYDGQSVATSTYALSHTRNISLMLQSNLTLVAKYETSNSYTIQTQTTYELIDSSGSISEVDSLSSVSTANGVTTTTIGSNTYAFVGYFAKVYNYSSVAKYIKVGTSYGSSYSGTYANIVGRFVKVNTVTLSPSISNANSTITYVRSTYYPVASNTALCSETVSGSVSLSVLSLSSATLTNNPKDGYSASATALGTISSNISRTISITRIGVTTYVNVNANKINSVTISTVSGAQNSVIISQANSEVNVTFSIPTGSTSEMIVGVYGVDSSYSTFTVTNENNNVQRSILPGSVISLSFTLGYYEQFDGYSITAGYTSVYSQVVYDYYVTSNYSNVTILGNFNSGFFATIVDSDTSKGTAILNKTGNMYSLNVTASDNYMIADVEFAKITNGAIGSFVSLQDSSISTLLGSYSFTNNGYSSQDSDNYRYPTSATATFTLLADVAVRVVYRHVTNVTFEVKESTYNSTFYTLYFDDTYSPLTLDKIKEYIDNLSTSSLREALSYTPEDLRSFEYLGTEIDSGTTIDISNLSDIIIVLNAMSEVNIIVNIDLSLDDSLGENTYNVPTNGLEITFDGETVSTYENANVFGYATAKSLSINARDLNSYFDFVGYYTQENEGGVLISTSSSYVFTRNNLNNLTQDEHGNYIVYAVFSERLQNIYIVSNYEESEFSLSVDGNTLLNVTTTLQKYTFDEGSFTYIYDEEESRVVITYPDSLSATAKNIYIHATDFNIVNSTDPLLPTGISEFVEKEISLENAIDNLYYRFYEYTDSNSKKLGETYRNVVSINLADYIAGTTITASAKRLYTVEFAYNYYSPEIAITLNILTIENNNPKSILIQEISNDRNYSSAIISYRVEEGSTVSVSVSYNSMSTDYEFSTLLGSTSVMLSDIFTNEVLGTTEAPTTEALASPSTLKDWWTNKLEGYVPTSKLHDTSAEEMSFSTYNFVAGSNISIMADFYSACRDARYYLFSALYNLGYDGNLNLNIVNDNMNNKTGDGFIFNLALPDSSYILEIVERTTNLTTKPNTYTTKVLKDALDGSGNLILQNQTINNGLSSIVYNRYNVEGVTNSSSSYMQTSLHILMQQYVGIDFSAKRLVKNYNEDSIGYSDDISEDFESELFYKTESSDSYEEYDEDTLTHLKTSTTVTLLARMVDGYYFKGFIAISTGYKSTYNVLSYGGDYVYSVGTTYTYLPHTMNTDENGEYVSAETTFVINGDMQVYAIYEARVFIITLNSYEYKEDNEELYVELKDEDGNLVYDEAGNVVLDSEKSKMTTEPIEGGKIKGSLIVEKNVTAKLTSITHPYFQFVGWATTFEFNNLINVAIDTGTGVADYESLRDTDANRYLQYNSVFPGQDEEGEFISSAGRNNLYIYDINSDMTINVYYTFMSYQLNIELSEILSTYTYADSALNSKLPGVSSTDTLVSTSSTDTYLTYADYIRNQPGWVNPSAGRYTFETTLGSSDRNTAETTTTIVIASNDPYVYVTNDYNGNEIGYPTKVAQSLISRVYSKETGTLCYKSNQYVNIAKNNNGTLAYQRIDYIYQLDLLNEYYDNNSEYISSLEELYQNGFSYNQCEIDSDGNFKMDNIYNYINASTVDGTTVYSLKPGLFTLTIDGEAYDSSQITGDNIQIDVENGTIKLNYKVVASTAGFPTVRVQINKNPSNLPGSIIPHSIELIGYSPTTQAEMTNNSYYVSGFNIGLFDSDDFMNDPEFDVGNLDVNMVIKWQQVALPVEAVITFDGTSVNHGVYLTGATSNPKTGLSRLKCRSATECAKLTSQSYVHEHDYEIEAYFLVVVENGQLVIEMLESIINDATADRNDKEKAKILFEFLHSITAGTTDEKGAGKIYLGNGETGQLVSSITDQLSYYFSYGVTLSAFRNLFNKYFPEYVFDADNFLTYRVIEVFDYYKKGISYNFYNNYMNSDDLVISQCILQEHQIMQHNDNYILWNTVLWSADKGYDYYRGASMKYTSNNSGNAFSSMTYDNNFANQTTDSSSNTLNWWQNAGNYIVGIFNGQEKYKGTYSRMLHSLISISDEQFSEQRMDYINSVVDIRTKEVIMSALHDWDNIPVSNALVAWIFYSPLLQLIDNIIILANGDSTIFEWMTNLNFF